MRAVFVLARIIAVLARWLSAKEELCDGESRSVEFLGHSGVSVSPGGWAYANVHSVSVTQSRRVAEERAARLRAELSWATDRLLGSDFGDAEWEACLPQICSVLAAAAPGAWRPLADAATTRCLDIAALQLREALLRRSSRTPAVGLEACWILQDCVDTSVDDAWTRSLARDTYAAAAAPGGGKGPEDSFALVGALVRLSEGLARVDRAKRRERYLLRPHLESINAWLEPRAESGGVWLPLYSLSSRRRLRLLKVHVESCEVMPSRARAPTLLYCEAIEDEEDEEEQDDDEETLAAAAAAAVPSLNVGGATDGDVIHVRKISASSHGHERTHGLADSDELKTRLERKVLAPMDWASREAWLRRTSPYSGEKGWRLTAFLVKAEDDLRREQLAMQFVRLFCEIFASEGLSETAWLRPYSIVCAGARAGLVEALADAKSLDFIKQQLQDLNQPTTVSRYFELTFGEPGSEAHNRAATNFARSLASYSLLCFALDVKDRHNGNILLDREGHVVHIDFGYMLGDSPGSLNFETAPFKLTDDYIQILGGVGSPLWDVFAVTFARGLHALNANHPLLKALLVLSGENAGAAEALSRRFADLDGDPQTTARVATRLIHAAANSERTKRYDTFQWFQNRIMT